MKKIEVVVDVGYEHILIEGADLNTIERSGDNLIIRDGPNVIGVFTKWAYWMCIK